MKNYLELLRAKSKLPDIEYKRKIDLLLLNNITINPIKDYLQYTCSQEGIEAEITFGDYDNIVQNANELEVDNKVGLVFWELANCLHGLEYKIESLNQNELLDLETKIQTELRLTFESLSKASLVIMNEFTALPFCYLQTENGELESLATRLNDFCRREAPSAFKWINIDKCLVKNGVENCIDYKGYLKNKLLYKHHFYWDYAQLVQPYFNAVTGKVKKLLAIDCDNTLWKGILGEDGVADIAMDENTFTGQPFASAHYRAKGLGKKGVLVALSSKNNSEDVQHVLDTHKAVVLKEDLLVAQKVNWEAKGENLKELAKELNIGIDSFVFIDDSDFEVQLMKDQLPAVKTIQVPKNSVNYYIEQQRWSNQFVQLNQSKEDVKKLEQYKQNVSRANAEKKYDDFEGFLQSLNLKLTIYRNDKEIIPRIAQMTQKTNQFNLTTKRYTELQIEQMTTSSGFDCIAFGVEDKFGDSGITGLCIINYENAKHATIDTLLMSCRILGRKIEYKFLEEILSLAFNKVDVLDSSYVRTNKNAQVAEFYKSIGFTVEESSESKTTYSMKKATFEPSKKYNYITLTYA